MQCLLRTFNPGIDSKSGAPLPAGTVRSGAEQWATFEALLGRALEELGFAIDRQPEHPTEPDRDGDYRLRIYAHRTRRDVGRDGLFIMQMHLAELFTIDPRGWGADHSRVPLVEDFADVDPAAAETFRRERLARFLRTGSSKHRQPRGGAWRRLRGRLFGPRDYIFAPLQIPRDYVQLHHSRITVLEFIDRVAEWCDRRRLPVVFKPHPYNTGDHDLLERLEHHRRRSSVVHRADGNIHDLIAGARAVYTINSGVGFESLFHGKPVAIFGDSDYRSVALRVEPGGLDRTWERVLSYGEEERGMASRFLWHYAHRHAFDITRIEELRLASRLVECLSAALAPGAASASRAPDSPPREARTAQSAPGAPPAPRGERGR